MIIYRSAEPSEINHVLRWAAAEGWNPGLEDAAAFFEADPDGFFLAVDDNTPVAAISVVNHNPGFAFLGLYIVLPDYRGRGIGYALWQHALDHAGDRTVGLDGVPEQQASYAASGFRHAGGTTRFEGKVAASADETLRLATSTDIPSLIAMEAEASGTAKPAYLSAWFTQTNTRRTIVAGTPGAVTAACTVRLCGNGAKIGPLTAPDRQTAARLIAHAAQMTSGPVILDVPQSSETLTDLCLSLGMQAGFHTARMYRGPFSAPPAGIFAVTSLELG
ncbi:GNAT family N-acetyltransferase [uncultured Roseobacter sp.]|uniref:GNAT family N-acetyltransferase n=1 Tax=uncultured Roseobacter sp. TaxID=114847 RepID=UPI002606FB90|nr:GNAT family N-acetyltransferase [uncultured Roseobacter sp.]